MKTGKYYAIGMLLSVAALVATMVVYPQLPSSVATHWNVHNRANGYSPKWALFLIGPGLLAGMTLLMYFLPWLSPKHFEVDSFRLTYFEIMVILIVLLSYLYGLTLWAGIGHPNIGRAMVGGIGLLFALLGNVMGKVRRNFYIGIRTPWALANERVWNATHRFAAKTMVVGGLAGLALSAAGLEGWPVFAVLMAGVLVPAVYSLMFYKQLERRGEL